MFDEIDILTKGVGRKIMLYGMTNCGLVTASPLLKRVLQCLKMLSAFSMKPETWH